MAGRERGGAQSGQEKKEKLAGHFFSHSECENLRRLIKLFSSFSYSATHLNLIAISESITFLPRISPLPLSPLGGALKWPVKEGEERKVELGRGRRGGRVPFSANRPWEEKVRREAGGKGGSVGASCVGH